MVLSAAVIVGHASDRTSQHDSSMQIMELLVIIGLQYLSVKIAVKAADMVI